MAALSTADDGVGSLCCECGMFRPGAGRTSLTTNFMLYDPDEVIDQLGRAILAMVDTPNRRTTQEYYRFWNEKAQHPYENDTCELRCSNCLRVTRHAVVNGARHQDWTEAFNRRGGPTPPIEGSDEDLCAAMGIRIVEVDDLPAVCCYVASLAVGLVRRGLSTDERSGALEYLIVAASRASAPRDPE